MGASFHRRLKNQWMVKFLAMLWLSGHSHGGVYHWDSTGDGNSSLGGTGTWDTTSLHWDLLGTDAAVDNIAWPGQADIAVFGGTAGNVTLSVPITAGGLTFDVSGYTLAGSTLTLASTNNQISVAGAASATINSTLTGTAGFTKLGAGVLVLGAANTLSGNVAVSAGVLQITNDSALGQVANDLVNNGTLKTTASVALGAGRDISGSSTFDIAAGTTLSVHGNITNSATILANSGTLSVQGSTRSLGSITLSAAGTINSAGSINATSLTTPSLTNGTATINPDIVFTSGTKTINVGSGGNVVLNGALSGASFLAKTGAGTLTINGVNSVQTRIGIAGASPTAGGTVILGSAASGGSGQIQLNYGTLTGESDLILANGLTIGGRLDSMAVLTGSSMVFQGRSGFFRGTGTSGELRLEVHNTATFAGGFAAPTGAGTATGITFGGTGTVIISGDSSALLDKITLTDGVKLTLTNTIGGGLNVGAGNVLGGNGTVLGSLHLVSGAKFVFSPTDTLTVNGPSVSFGGFGISDLIGLSAATPNGIYTIIDGIATINTNDLLDLGDPPPFQMPRSYDLGSGKTAYFTRSNGLQVHVISDSPIHDWRRRHYGTTLGAGTSADLAAPDGDGIPNLIKYALCLDPGRSSADLMPVAEILETSGDQYLCFRFTRSPGRKDVVIVVEASSFLDNTWTELARSTNGAPFSIPAAVSQTPRDANSPYDIDQRVDCLIRDVVPISGSTRRFMRLRVIRP